MPENESQHEADWEAELATHASHVAAEKEEAAKEAKYKEELPKDRQERKELIHSHGQTLSELGKLGFKGMPKLEERSEDLEHQIAEANERVIQSRETVDKAEQQLDHIVNRIAELAHIDRGEMTPEDFNRYITQDASAREVITEGARSKLRQYFETVFDARRKLTEVEAGLGKLSGQLEHIDDNAIAAQELIIKANDLYDAIQNIEGHRRLTVPAPKDSSFDEEVEWSKTHTETVKEGNPLLMSEVQEWAEEENVARDKFINQAYWSLNKHHSSHDREPTHAGDTYIKSMLSHYLSEDLRRDGKNAFFDYNQADGYAVGIENARDPMNRDHDRQQHTESFYRGEKMADLFSRFYNRPRLNSFDYNNVIAHRGSIEELKALAEASEGKDILWAGSDEWVDRNGNARRALEQMRFVATPGEPIVPEEWLRDPQYREQLQEAREIYTKKVEQAKAALHEHNESITEKRKQQLEKFKGELDELEEYEKETERISQERKVLLEEGSVLTDAEKHQLDHLRSQYRNVENELIKERGKKVNFVSRSLGYDEDTKEQHIKAIDSRLNHINNQVKIIESAPENRLKEAEALDERWREMAARLGTSRSDIPAHKERLKGWIAELEKQLKSA